LSIYNYTAAAQYRNIWTNSERVCRGLIVEDGTNKIIARGPEKFFNYGQTGAPETTLDTLVRVTAKEDGSLGIGWIYSHEGRNHFGIATRGSFTSEQATHASNKLGGGETHLRNNILERAEEGRTAIYEIVYPGNRIVLDYGDRDELIRLGSVGNKSGLIEARYLANYRRKDADWMEWTNPITLREALELPIPADEEGFVLDIFEDEKVTGHVKLKGEEYKILHGLLTNTNARRIWVQLAARECHMFVDRPDDWANKVGHDPADFARVDVTKSIEETLLTNVPDEFYDWVTKQIDSMTDRATDLVAQTIYLAAQVNLISDKRARYEWVKDHAMCKEILAIAASGDMSNIGPVVTKAWKLVKPAGNDTPFSQEED
jgi:RNA ligase